MSDYDFRTAAVEGVICPRCEAKRKQPCVTMKGEPTTIHTPRYEPLRIAYGEGYTDGAEDMRR